MKKLNNLKIKKLKFLSLIISLNFLSFFRFAYLNFWRVTPCYVHVPLIINLIIAKPKKFFLEQSIMFVEGISLEAEREAPRNLMKTYYNPWRTIPVVPSDTKMSRLKASQIL